MLNLFFKVEKEILFTGPNSRCCWSVSHAFEASKYCRFGSFFTQEISYFLLLRTHDFHSTWFFLPLALSKYISFHCESLAVHERQRRLGQVRCLTVTLVPEVFLDFSTLEMREPRRGDRYKYYLVAKRRERKTSGYFGLESHFHADARVRIWPSGSDWLIFLQTSKSIWLVC